jgi:hypothetical protein
MKHIFAKILILSLIAQPCAFAGKDGPGLPDQPQGSKTPASAIPASKDIPALKPPRPPAPSVTASANGQQATHSTHTSPDLPRKRPPLGLNGQPRKPPLNGLSTGKPPLISGSNGQNTRLPTPTFRGSSSVPAQLGALMSFPNAVSAPPPFLGMIPHEANDEEDATMADPQPEPSDHTQQSALMSVASQLSLLSHEQLQSLVQSVQTLASTHASARNSPNRSRAGSVDAKQKPQLRVPSPSALAAHPPQPLRLVRSRSAENVPEEDTTHPKLPAHHRASSFSSTGQEVTPPQVVSAADRADQFSQTSPIKQRQVTLPPETPSSPDAAQAEDPTAPNAQLRRKGTVVSSTYDQAASVIKTISPNAAKLVDNPVVKGAIVAVGRRVNLELNQGEGRAYLARARALILEAQYLYHILAGALAFFYWFYNTFYLPSGGSQPGATPPPPAPPL